MEIDETARVLDRQRSPHDRVKQRKDACISPDAQREREDGHPGEAEVLQQLAEGEAKIIQHDRKHLADISADFPHLEQQRILVRPSTNQNLVESGAPD